MAIKDNISTMQKMKPVQEETLSEAEARYAFDCAYFYFFLTFFLKFDAHHHASKTFSHHLGTHICHIGPVRIDGRVDGRSWTHVRRGVKFGNLDVEIKC